jgi:hypothetical protein
MAELPSALQRKHIREPRRLRGRMNVAPAAATATAQSRNGM